MASEASVCPACPRQDHSTGERRARKRTRGCPVLGLLEMLVLLILAGSSLSLSLVCSWGMLKHSRSLSGHQRANDPPKCLSCSGKEELAALWGWEMPLWALVAALWEGSGPLGRAGGGAGTWCGCLHLHFLPFPLFQLHRLNWFRAAKLNEERNDQSNIS